MNPIGEPISVGEQGWKVKLKAQTARFGANFWERFTPVSPADIDDLESTIERALPADFRCFLASIGAGDFPDEFGGGIFNPCEIIEGCAGPMLMLLGSSPWAADEGQQLTIFHAA